MFYYIKGVTTEINTEEVVIENGEIGYRIITLAKDEYDLLENYKIYIYDHTNSDNEPVLYGFLDFEDLKLFKLLIKISGIGAKTAKLILNNVGAPYLISLIENKDIDSLKKISGIGSKANLVYYELKNKLKDFNMSLLRYENVYAALLQMDYNPLIARNAINSIDQNLSDEDALREALKRISYARK